MGKLFGIVAMLMGVWAAAEIYTRGFDSAFGGALASLDDPVVPLDQLHSGRAPRSAVAQSDSEDWTNDSDILVIEDEDPFAPRGTPVTRLGDRIQGQINGAYEDRYGGQ